MIKTRDTTVGYHCPYCGMSILNRINIFSMSGNLIKMKCVCGSSELVVQILKDNKFKLTVPCILCPNSHSYTLSSSTFFQRDLFPFSCKFTAINICFIGKGNKVYDALKKNEEELIKTFAAYEEEYGEVLDDADNDYFGLFDKFNDGFDEFDDDYDDDDDFDESGWDSDYEDNEHSGFILHKNEEYKPENIDTGDKNNIDIISNADNTDDLENIKVNSYQIVSQILDIVSRLYDERKIFCKCGDFDGKIVILNSAIHIECKNCGSYRDIKSFNLSDAEYLDGIETLYLDFDED